MSEGQEEIILAFLYSDILDDDEIQVKNNDSLFQSGILDSLNMIVLIGFIEKTFNIKIAPSEITIDNFDSVENIVSFVGRKHR